MSHKILVIEDNEEMCENIASILKVGRYDVLTSTTGKLGIELAEQNQPDLILCDIMMPGLDGYSVIHVLSKNPATVNIPFIFLTAKTDLRDFRTGMNLGADDYITKPFEGLELLNVIELRLKKNDLIKTTFHNTINDLDDFFLRTKQLPDFQKLSDHRKSRIYKKKELVYVEGEQQLYVYFVAKGLVKTFKATTDGKELITGLHKDGDFFGFVPLIEDRPNNESAIAMKESQIYMIAQQDFLTLINANKEIARKFISMLAKNLYEAENKLLELAYLSVRERVATVLIKLNKEIDSAINNDHSINVARKDLSGLVGTTTETLNRTLVDFKNEGLIEVYDQGLKILQHTKLERILRR